MLCLCPDELPGCCSSVRPGWLVTQHSRVAVRYCRYGAFDDYDEEDHILFQQNQGVGERLFLSRKASTKFAVCAWYIRGKIQHHQFDIHMLQCHLVPCLLGRHITRICSICCVWRIKIASSMHIPMHTSLTSSAAVLLSWMKHHLSCGCALAAR